MRSIKTILSGSVLALALSFGAAACGGGNSNNTDAGVTEYDAPPAGNPDASCFDNPQTYNEIINACTTAQSVVKHPNLPLLNDDGSLPALP